jgi:O-antigen ligase
MNADPGVEQQPAPLAATRRRARGRPSSARSLSNRRARRLRLADYLLLGGPIALFSIVHLLGGGAQPTAALWFAATIALLLPAMVLLAGRKGELSLIWPGRTAVMLFVAVLGVAVWTLLAPASGTNSPWAAIHGQSAISLDRSATLVEIIKLCALAGVFLLGCFEGVRTRRVAGAVRTVITIGAIWAVVGIVMFIADLQVRQDGRLTGGFLSANSGATVYGILLVLSLAVLARASRSLRLGRTFGCLVAFGASVFCVILFVGCLLATASRMGLAATSLAVIVFLVWEALSRKDSLSKRTIGLTVAGALVGLIGIAGADTLWARFDTLDADAANRSVIFTAHWRAFLDAPLFGHGLGSFSAVNAQQMTPENYGALRSIRAAHNVYIQWLEEAGVFGALPMFGLIAVLIGGGLRRSHQAPGGAIQRGLIAANLVVLLHGTTDYALQVPSIAAFWAYLLGLQFSYGKARARK